MFMLLWLKPDNWNLQAVFWAESFSRQSVVGTDTDVTRTYPGMRECSGSWDPCFQPRKSKQLWFSKTLENSALCQSRHDSVKIVDSYRNSIIIQKNSVAI